MKLLVVMNIIWYGISQNIVSTLVVGTYFNLIENEQIGGIQYFEDSENPKGGIVYTTLGEDYRRRRYINSKTIELPHFAISRRKCSE